MSIDPVNSTSSSAKAPVNPKGELGKDAFLKLLVMQLRHQDPMAPKENTEFIGQMTQFTTLEQMTNLNKHSEKSALSAAMSQAVGMIGRNVTYNAPVNQDTPEAGVESRTGAVDRVTVEEGVLYVHIGTDKVVPSDIHEVK